MEMARMRRWRERDEQGILEFEFVLVFPFVLILVFLLVEMTAAMTTWSSLEHASREGARYGAIGASQAAVEGRTRERSGGVLDGSGTVAVIGAGGAPGTDVQVRVTYQYTPKTPLVGLLSVFTGGSVPSITMNAQSHFLIEGR
jgi:Flp pilus assembly protein TadG